VSVQPPVWECHRIVKKSGSTLDARFTVVVMILMTMMTVMMTATTRMGYVLENQVPRAS